MSALSLTHAQQQFTDHLSAVEDAARYAFRGRRRQDREEALAEATASAWSAWYGLIRKGKDPLAVGVTGSDDPRQRGPGADQQVGQRVGDQQDGHGEGLPHETPLATSSKSRGAPPKEKGRL